jgi:hypothetical protein
MIIALRRKNENDVSSWPRRGGVIGGARRGCHERNLGVRSLPADQHALAVSTERHEPATPERASWPYCWLVNQLCMRSQSRYAYTFRVEINE